MFSAEVRSAKFADLPDEIVRKILEYTLEREEPFAVDYCRERFTRSDTGLDIPGVVWHHGENPLDNDGFEIHYPHCQQSSTVRTDRTHMQTHHLADWIRINTTCRGFRRLGKELYFGTKIFHLARDIPGQLQARTYPIWSSDDQALAMERIHHVLIYDGSAPSASPFLSLPKRLAGFTRLERFTLMFGLRERDPLDEVRTAMQQPNGPRPMPRELLDALVSVGLRTDGVEHRIALASTIEWSFIEDSLRRNVYPMLEIKASMLAKRKAREDEEQMAAKRQQI